MKTQAVFDAMRGHGIFVLASSRPIAKGKVLGPYYTRNQIEQVFGICKDYTNMLPLRVQSEKTLRGHLILSFIVRKGTETIDFSTGMCGSFRFLMRHFFYFLSRGC